jgi:hypothetical protein
MRTLLTKSFPTIVPRGDASEKEADRIADHVMHDSARTLASVSRTHSMAVIAGAGRPLEPAVRDFFERRFGHDFGLVRIHTDDQTSTDIGARAFTTGNHVVFAPGRYAPGTTIGRRLIAHELAHTIQQAGAAPGAVIHRQPDDTTAHLPYGAVLRKVATSKVWMVSDPNRARDSILTKLDRNERVRVLDLGLSEDFNKRADSKHQWWRVKVFYGTHQDQEGWVREGSLERNYTVKKTGDRTTGRLGDATVNVETGQIVESDVGIGGDNMFTVSYKGSEASQMRWIQFIWREIIAVDDNGNATAQSQNIQTTIGNYPLALGGTESKFGTPKKENWNTDAVDPTNPFFEADTEADIPGSAERTPGSTSVMDSPLPGRDIMEGLLNGGAKLVVARAHTRQFLVKDETTVVFETSVDIEWRASNIKQLSARGVQKAGSMGPASALPPDIAARLHQQYPAYKNLK